MSELSTSHNQSPRRARRIAAAILAPVLAAGVAGGAVAYERSQHKAQSQQEELARAHDDARLTIATRRFKDPRLESVSDTGHVVKGSADSPNANSTYDTVQLKLSLPQNPVAAKVMEQYAHSNAVNWLGDPTLASATIVKGQDGKYKAIGSGFGAPINKQLTIQNGMATAVIHPRTTDTVGTKVALYVESDVNTPSNAGITETQGEQYVGAVELVEHNGRHEWIAMPEQPQLPDIVNTTFSPWQS